MRKIFTGYKCLRSVILIEWKPLLARKLITPEDFVGYEVDKSARGKFLLLRHTEDSW
jgi:hypothetical protein